MPDNGTLESRRARESFGALLRDDQIVVVGRKRCPQTGLEPLVDPVLLASLDDGREPEEAGEEGDDGEKHEVGDETACEAGQNR